MTNLVGHKLFGYIQLHSYVITYIGNFATGIDDDRPIWMSAVSYRECIVHGVQDEAHFTVVRGVGCESVVCRVRGDQISVF